MAPVLIQCCSVYCVLYKLEYFYQSGQIFSHTRCPYPQNAYVVIHFPLEHSIIHLCFTKEIYLFTTNELSRKPYVVW